MTSTSRTPRRPSIGFCSCSRRTASSSWRSCSVASSPASATLTRQVGEVGQELVQRRVDQPDRHRLARPSPRGSPRSRRAAAVRARPGRPAAARRSRPGSGRSTSWRRSPRNMCSVRTRPTPVAPNRRARAQSGPLSALACTPSRRACVRVGHDRVHGGDELVVVRRQLALEVLHHVGRDHRDLAQVHRARGAVDGDHVALADHDAAWRGELLAAACRRSSSSAPQTQVLPMPRATTAAWLVLPPRLVSTPWAAIMPCRSSGLVSRRTRMTCSPRVGPRDRGRRVEDHLADGGARRGADRLGDPLMTSPEVSKRGNISRASSSPDTRVSASSMSIMPWSTSCVGDAERRRRGALADPGLQHPELAALDRELDVAQVPVVVLQRPHDRA